MGVNIITNVHERELISWNDLTEKEQNDHDYLSWDDHDEKLFARYKGEVYFTGDFILGATIPIQWDGIKQDTFFSGILMKFVEEDTDYVIMGRYYE